MIFLKRSPLRIVRRGIFLYNYFMKIFQKLFANPWSILINLLVLVMLDLLTPLEKTLGANIRLIYFHGVWVWAGIIFFGLAAVSGLAALLIKKEFWHTYSRAAGYTALLFWITYLPMSLIVMKINWGGFFFDEPRWRVPMSFAVISILLQVGLFLVSRKAFTSGANLAFGLVLYWSLFSTQSVLHPDSPIQQSSGRIQIFFSIMLFLTLLLALQISCWIKKKLPDTQT